MSFMCAICFTALGAPDVNGSDPASQSTGHAQLRGIFPVATRCGHLFHNHCLDTWIRSQFERSVEGGSAAITCPYCTVPLPFYTRIYPIETAGAEPVPNQVEIEVAILPAVVAPEPIAMEIASPAPPRQERIRNCATDSLQAEAREIRRSRRAPRRIESSTEEVLIGTYHHQSARVDNLNTAAGYSTSARAQENANSQPNSSFEALRRFATQIEVRLVPLPAAVERRQMPANEGGEVQRARSHNGPIGYWPTPLSSTRLLQQLTDDRFLALRTRSRLHERNSADTDEASIANSTGRRI